MKVILTTAALLFFTVSSIAQESGKIVRATAQNEKAAVVVEVENLQVTLKENHTARLYMFKNSRIKKELAFKTKRNKSKLA